MNPIARPMASRLPGGAPPCRPEGDPDRVSLPLEGDRRVVVPRSLLPLVLRGASPDRDAWETALALPAPLLRDVSPPA